METIPRNYIKQFLQRFKSKNPDFPRFGESIVLIVLLMIVQFVVGFSLLFVLNSFGHTVESLDARVISLSVLVSFAAVICWGTERNSDSLPQIFPFRFMTWKAIGIAVLISLGCSLLALGYVHLIHSLSLDSGTWQFDWSKHPETFSQGIFSFGLAVLVAPFCEEVFFRGLLLHSFLRKYRVKNALAMNALLFALLHGSIDQFLAYFLIGFLVAWLRVWSGSLSVCILVHSLYNLLAYGFIQLGSYRAFSQNTIILLSGIGTVCMILGLSMMKMQKPMHEKVNWDSSG